MGSRCHCRVYKKAMKAIDEQFQQGTCTNAEPAQNDEDCILRWINTAEEVYISHGQDV